MERKAAACRLCFNAVVWGYFWYNFTNLYFNNPDDTECFADVKGGKVDNMEANSSMIDVSGQFSSWIRAGFLIFTAAPLFMVSGAMMQTVMLNNPTKSPFEHPTYGKFFTIVSLCGLIQMLATLYLPIWGYFIRFDKAGELCSGDLYEGSEENPKPYLWEAGSWIYFYVVLIFTMFFIMFSLCCCVLILAISAKDDGRRPPV